jgi:alpha-galactosidase
MLDGKTEIPRRRSHEYASYIIEAVEKDEAVSIWGNVTNAGSIDNLPEGCVEVECKVDGDGFHPINFGKLPEQLAALNRAHMAVHELVVESLLEHDRTKALYALSLDPLTAAVCSLDEIEKMFDEMWEAQRPFLAPFEQAARAG